MPIGLSKTIFTSAARTATPTAVVIDQPGRAPIMTHIIIDVTAVTATPSVVFTFANKDPTSGVFYTVLESAAITATGTTVLKIGNGLTPSANAVANDFLAQTWRVTPTHADADSITYSVGVNQIHD